MLLYYVWSIKFQSPENTKYFWGFGLKFFGKGFGEDFFFKKSFPQKNLIKIKKFSPKNYLISVV